MQSVDVGPKIQAVADEVLTKPKPVKLNRHARRAGAARRKKAIKQVAVANRRMLKAFTAKVEECTIPQLEEIAAELTKVARPSNSLDAACLRVVAARLNALKG